MNVQGLADALNKFYNTSQYTTSALKQFAEAWKQPKRPNLLSRHRQRRHK